MAPRTAGEYLSAFDARLRVRLSRTLIHRLRSGPEVADSISGHHSEQTGHNLSRDIISRIYLVETPVFTTITTGFGQLEHTNRWKVPWRLDMYRQVMPL